MINNYSDCLAGILADSSRHDVKYKRPGFNKPYWSVELSDLKRLSVQAHNIILVSEWSSQVWNIK